MGVINLGLLVEKIKRKLEDSGFIKSTDYASASAAGVVKVGDGLAITDAGVLSVSGGTGGFTADVLFTEGESPVALAQNATVTLAHNYSDYKIIALVLRRNNDGYTTCFYDATTTAKQLVPYVNASGTYALCGTTFSDETPTTLKIADASTTTNMYIAKVIGYK